MSYAHGDADTVYAELTRLRERGVNIWFDEGISPGHSWPQELAQAIQNCAAFVLFVTPRSARSDNCERETTFALDAQRPFLAIHLEETELPPGLKLAIGNSQAILRHHESRSTYGDKVHETLTEMLGTSMACDPIPQAKRSLLPKAGIALAIAVAVGVAAYGYQAYQRNAWRPRNGRAASRLRKSSRTPAADAIEPPSIWRSRLKRSCPTIRSLAISGAGSLQW